MDFTPNQESIAACYRLLIGVIVPRPIAVVGTVSLEGRPNLAPFSFFTGIGSRPMSLLFCPVNNRDGGEKDSLRNAKSRSEGGQGEFTVSVCTEPIVRRVATAAEALPFGESEFALAGLHERRSTVVAPPSVAESPAVFECRTLQVVRLAAGQAGGGNIVVGEVVHVWIDDALISDGAVDPQRLRAVARMGGDSWATTRERFNLAMGREAMQACLPIDFGVV
ncbi:MAG: flavin reductase family protein [Planctomycetes bacterium]|nr:flavin reductase family protein [Planctomycetota bacterium]